MHQRYRWVLLLAVAFDTHHCCCSVLDSWALLLLLLLYHGNFLCLFDAY
jgi:hypothetical protein